MLTRAASPLDPFDRLTWRLRLQRGRPADVVRLALASGAVTWLPVALLSLVDWLITGRRDNLLNDPVLDVRLLASLPLLFLADYLHHQSSVECINHLVAEGVAGNDTARMVQLADKMTRRRAAALPELVFVVLAVGVGAYVLIAQPGATGLFTGTGSAVWSWARAWYCLAALPIYLFVLCRTAWHWLLWCWFLLGLSHLSLQLMATHPDRRGGVSVLSKPSVAFAPFFTATGALAAARWVNELSAQAADLKVLLAPVVVLVSLAVFVTVAPLLLFTGQMVRARNRAVLEYGALAFDYTRSFHQRWLVARAAAGELLGTPDVQSLADLGTSYGVVDEMRSIPIGPRRLIFIIAATLAPLVPLALYRVPFWELVERILKAVV